MFICNRDFDLFFEGKRFSFIKGQEFYIDDHDTVKSLLANNSVVEYNYSDPVIEFSRTGIKFHKMALETK